MESYKSMILSEHLLTCFNLVSREVGISKRKKGDLKKKFLGQDLDFFLFFLVKIVFSSFCFLVKILFSFFLSWSKTCFLSFFLKVSFFYKFLPQIS